MKANCQKCGAEFQAQVIRLFGATITGNLCEPCDEAREAEWQATKHTVEKMHPEYKPARAEQWDRLCRDAGFGKCLKADPARFPEWLGEIDSGALLQSSRPGTGKTFSAVEIIRRKFVIDHRTVKMWDAISFGMEVATQDSDRREKAITDAIRVDWLLIDDIGKGKLTERALEAFFHVIDKREQAERSTVWTTNASADNFRNWMGDYAEPFLERLRRSTKTYLYA